MDKGTLGQLLIELRKRENISQKEMAETLSISSSTLCKWEHGQNFPDLTMLGKIADIFHIPVEKLLQPAETLEQIRTGSLFSNAESTSKSGNNHEPTPTKSFNKRRKTIFIGILIGAFILGLMSYLIYQHSKPDFWIVDAFYDYNGHYGIHYNMSVVCKEDITREEIQAYENEIYVNWLNSKYDSSTNFVAIELLYYHNETDAKKWTEPNSRSVLLK